MLLLTVDDCSGLFVSARFGKRDTAGIHFQPFRKAFERHGLPEAIYTDALSLFGPTSSNPYAGPRSEFQRALRHPTSRTSWHRRRKPKARSSALFKPFKAVSSPCWPTQKSTTGSPPI